MTGLAAIFDLPILMYVTLWALVLANTVTVIQRVQMVYRQVVAEEASAAAADVGPPA